MIIGIGGVSRAGKTTLAKKLKERLGHSNTIIISQDDFVLQESQLPKYMNLPDWEHPNGIDFKALIDTTRKAFKNNYYVIVEGFLIYYNQELSSLFDLKVFITIDENTFLKRKMMDDRWEKSPILYISHIWESYLKFGLVNKNNVDVIVDGCKAFDLNTILNLPNSEF